MRVAVGFFYDVKKYFKYIKNMGMIIIISLVISLIGTMLVGTNFVSNNILTFATNLSRTSEISIKIEDIAFLYGIFDRASYITDVKENLERAHTAKTLGQDVFDTTIVDTTEVMFKKDNPNLSITEASGVQKISVYDMMLLNYSSKRDINILKLFEKNILLAKKGDPIFIYTTHTSESYTNSQRYKFDYTSLYRTTDAKYNMLSVGAEFSKALSEKNMKVIFDTTPHDYGTYEIAYTNSRKTLTNAINANERIGLAIDMHRDAMADLTNGPVSEIKGQKVAKIMFVMGVGTENYQNCYWEDNLALALQLQKLGEEMYPGLFRPMIIRNSKYNQDLVKYSFLIEIGTTGNTLEEAYLAARCLANILNKFYNN